MNYKESQIHFQNLSDKDKIKELDRLINQYQNEKDIIKFLQELKEWIESGIKDE